MAAQPRLLAATSAVGHLYFMKYSKKFNLVTDSKIKKIEFYRMLAGELHRKKEEVRSTNEKVVAGLEHLLHRWSF